MGRDCLVTRAMNFFAQYAGLSVSSCDARDEGHPMSEGSITVRDNGMRFLAGSKMRQESFHAVRDCKK